MTDWSLWDFSLSRCCDISVVEVTLFL